MPPKVKEDNDVLLELLKQLAESFSTQTKLAARNWLALALVSALTICKCLKVIPSHFCFVGGSVETDFCAFSFALISIADSVLSSGVKSTWNSCS